VSVQSVQRDVRATVVLVLSDAADAATTEVRDEAPVVATGLNVGVVSVLSADSGAETEERAQADNGSTTDVTARLVSEDLDMPSAQRMRGKTLVRVSTVMSVEIDRVDDQMSVLTDALSDETIALEAVPASSVAVRAAIVEVSLEIASNPLRAQT
jgi:hypothetical protein